MIVLLLDDKLMDNSISNLLFKFANSFDLKDWQGLAETLLDNIECDYQDSRGKSGIFTKLDYVNAREKALNHLKTHHLLSNLEITEEGSQAYCRASAIIYRTNSENKHFDSHVIYYFVLIKLQDETWKIKKIKQSVLWNEGDASVHGG